MNQVVGLMLDALDESADSILAIGEGVARGLLLVSVPFFLIALAVAGVKRLSSIPFRFVEGV